MPIPFLPPEITDRIIDHLWDDPAVLYSCSLVARSWAASSRYHLFSTLRIVSRRPFDGLVKLARRRAPHIVPLFHLVHELQVYDVTAKKKPYARIVPHVFAAHMPNLRTLRFYQADWRQVTPMQATFPMFLAQFTSVTQLELDGCICANLKDFQRVICAFPMLEHLFVRGDDPFTLPPNPQHNLTALTPPPRTVQRPRLLSLGLWFRSHWHKEHTLVWEWLLDTPSKDTLHSVCVYAPGTEWHPPYGQMLQAVGPSLLRLDTPLLLDGEHCTLSSNTNLRELVINMANSQSWPVAWSAFTRLASQITSHHLRRLTFNLYVCGEQDEPGMRGEADTKRLDELWDNVDWNELNRVIMGDIFSGLEEVCVRLQWALWDGAFQKTAAFRDFKLEIENRIRRLHWHDRGILSITHGPPINEVYDFDFKQYKNRE